jgi:hypothetical protein
MQQLTIGNRGADVRALQVACNKRAESRRIAQIHVDGELGVLTIRACKQVAFAMGAAESTLDNMMETVVPVGVQRMIRWPTSRTPAALLRARNRKRAAQTGTNAVDSLREKAHWQARKLVGIMEQGGNNVGRQVEEIIREGGGIRGQAWCGWFCAAVYKRAGSKAVTWRWGAVRLYLPGSGISRTSNPLKGNLVRFIFDHIGMFEAWCDANGRETTKAKATHIRTIEGNTGRSGAVSDSSTGGDGVYVKVRARSLIRDFIHISR